MSSISLSEVTIVELIKKCRVSSVFRSTWHDKDCILKVFHPPQPVPESYLIDPRYIERYPYKCESAAYTRLKEQGICDRGYVPDFYGLIEQIDPKEHLPHLEDFLEDTAFPNALLIEYVPDCKPLNLSNYSAERVHKLRQILSEIHDAGVSHEDPYPRNMMVQQSSHKVLWVDFDRAQTFTLGSIKPYQLELLESESMIMDDFVESMTQDAVRGKIHTAWCFYYEGFEPPTDEAEVCPDKEPEAKIACLEKTPEVEKEHPDKTPEIVKVCPDKESEGEKACPNKEPELEKRHPDKAPEIEKKRSEKSPEIEKVCSDKEPGV